MQKLKNNEPRPKFTGSYKKKKRVLVTNGVVNGTDCYKWRHQPFTKLKLASTAAKNDLDSDDKTDRIPHRQ